jgi:rare lipoprotein A (peptidoglycan hydrolase)
MKYTTYRKLLKGNEPMPEETEIVIESRPVAAWVFILICAFLSLCLIFGCAPLANAYSASYYSVDSLKREGTWAYSHGIMANGKVFNENAYTCATRLWRIGTTLRVTNSSNNKSIIVRVTDKIGRRFASKRIDLSKGAFQKIANANTGIIKVKVIKVHA